jgi:hypothetical protein
MKFDLIRTRTAVLATSGFLALGAAGGLGAVAHTAVAAPSVSITDPGDTVEAVEGPEVAEAPETGDAVEAVEGPEVPEAPETAEAPGVADVGDVDVPGQPEETGDSDSEH